MLQSSRRLLIASVVLISCGVLLSLPPRTSDVRAETQRLTAGGELKWYRGNLHTHSLWSDGDDYLESIGAWYREHDYQFLAFTDHNTLADKERWVDVEKSKGGQVAFDKLKKRFPENWIAQRQSPDNKLEVKLKTFAEVAAKLNEPGKYLLLQGEEISDAFANAPIHMNASNIKELIVPRHGASVVETIQNNTDALISQRERTGQPMMIHLNHPNFGYGVTAEDLMPIRGENFFEVYNGHPTVNNSGTKERASTERIWDIVNTRRLSEFRLPLLYGLATDDGHSYHKMPSRVSEPGRGWVMVLAPELEAGTLIKALEAGRFYSSSGVALESVTSTVQGLDIAVKAEPGQSYVIEFIGTRRGYDAKHQPVLDRFGKVMRTTERYSDDVGKVFATSTGTKASYRFQPADLYVRARVTSSQKHPNPGEVGEFQRAWSQPILGPAVP